MRRRRLRQARRRGAPAARARSCSSPTPRTTRRRSGADDRTRHRAPHRPRSASSAASGATTRREQRYDTFDVAVGPSATVLDALVAIQRQQDPTLALRHSCFHASCGTCGVRVNGREGLACVTARPRPGDEVDGRAAREPPGRHRPRRRHDVVLRAVRRGRHGRYVRAERVHARGEPPDGIDRLGRYEDCIECGICLSACPVAGSDPRYVGPAALAAAQRLLEEPRGADPGPVIRLDGRRAGGLALPRRVRVHRGVPVGRRPGRRDHAAAPGGRRRPRVDASSASEGPADGHARPSSRGGRSPGRPQRRGIVGWFDPRGRRLGGLAFPSTGSRASASSSTCTSTSGSCRCWSRARRLGRRSSTSPSARRSSSSTWSSCPGCCSTA